MQLLILIIVVSATIDTDNCGQLQCVLRMHEHRILSYIVFFTSRCPCARKDSGSVSRMMYYLYVQYKSIEKYPSSLLIYCLLSVVHIIHPKFKFFQRQRVGQRHSTYNEGFLKIQIQLWWMLSLSQNIIFAFQINTYRVLTQFRITRTTTSTKKIILKSSWILNH